ncbi:MAG: rhomboid family intramembrane serine protease [Solobacterium sp.]|nr:rhomboid family intramembrane serine protease [Solobacterium sp.]
MKQRKTVATNVIIAICFVVWLFIQLFPSDSTITNSILIGAFYKPFVLAGEYWRLLTAGFVHVELWHLAMNMMALLSLGKIFEPLLGVRRYLLILIPSIIVGSLFVLSSPENSFVVGISGGIYGLLAAYITLILRTGGWRMPPVRAALMNMLFINLLLNFLPNISVHAHLGGFVTGLIMYGFITTEKEEVYKRINHIVALTGLVVVLCFISWQNRSIPTRSRYLGTDYNVLQILHDGPLHDYSYFLAERLDRVYGLDDGLVNVLGKE